MGIVTVGKFTVNSSSDSKDGKHWFGNYRITCDGSHVDMKTIDDKPFSDPRKASEHALKVGVEHARTLPQD